MIIKVRHIVSAWKIPVRVGITPMVVPMPDAWEIKRDWVDIIIWGRL